MRTPSLFLPSSSSLSASLLSLPFPAPPTALLPPALLLSFSSAKPPLQCGMGGADRVRGGKGGGGEGGGRGEEEEMEEEEEEEEEEEGISPF